MKNGEVINLLDSEYFKNNLLIIPEAIDEITITSNGKNVRGAISLSPRITDIKINIKNLNLDSEDNIAIDFREGQCSTYNNYLFFSEKNIIKSKKNIAICLSNNQKLIICGEVEGKLEVIGGSYCNGVGSNIYTKGNGHIKFCGEGEVVVKGGNGYIPSRRNSSNGQSGAYAIGFYSDDTLETSSVEIMDNISVFLYGGEGESISSKCEDNIAGKGGEAISLDEDSIINIIGNGEVKLQGGNGGTISSKYCSGISGKGGAGISLKSGIVNIANNTTIIAGSGGNIDEHSKECMCLGGDGASCIEAKNKKNFLEGKEIIINLYDNVKAIGGNAGNSGVSIEGKYLDGGIGGKLLEVNNRKCTIKTGKIFFQEGSNGLNTKLDTRYVSKYDNKLFIGENIEIIKCDSYIFKEEKEKEDEKINIKDLEEEYKMQANSIPLEVENLGVRNENLQNNLPQIKEQECEIRKGIFKCIISFFKKLFE